MKCSTALLLILGLATHLFAEETIPSFGEVLEESESSLFGSGAPVSSLEAYSNYGWAPATTDAIAAPPALEIGETIRTETGIASAGKTIFWVTNRTEDGKKLSLILAWNFETGHTIRTTATPKAISGIAYDAEAGLLLVRQNAEIVYYDPENLSVKRKSAFLKTTTSWRHMTIFGENLVLINAATDGLDVYDKKTLSLTRSIPTGSEKIQRVIVFDASRLLLWSSYWGAKAKLFDVGTGQMDDTLFTTFAFRSMFKVCALEGGKLGIFDPLETKVVGFVIKNEKSLINLHAGAERSTSALAYRFAPLTQTIRGTLKLQAVADTKDSVVAVALPHRSTYSQEVRNELYNGKETFDSFGNRYLALRLGPLKKGQKYEIEFYRAEITRYQASFDILSAQKDQKAAPQLARYLADNPIYQMTDPMVVAVHEQTVGSFSSYLDKIVAAHAFSMSIKPLWDGKNEAVPSVLRNMHGGCNEHTRVIVAFLRMAGIPCRYAWNHIWRGADEKKEFVQDHAVAEAWISDLGWVPLEGLGKRAGFLSPYIMFNVGYPESNSDKPNLGAAHISLKKNKGSVSWRLEQ